MLRATPTELPLSHPGQSNFVYGLHTSEPAKEYTTVCMQWRLYKLRRTLARPLKGSTQKFLVTYRCHMVIICRLKSSDIYLTYIIKYMLISFDKQLLRPVVFFVRRTSIHYKRGLYHGYGTRTGNITPGVRPCHITRKWTRAGTAPTSLLH